MRNERKEPIAVSRVLKPTSFCARSRSTLMSPYKPVLRCSDINVNTTNYEWRTFFNVISRQFRLIVVTDVIIFVVFVLLLLLLPASYESTTKVVVDPPGSEAFSLQGTFQGTSEPDYIETQAQILRSGGVGVEVVRALRLDCSPIIMKKSWIETVIDRLQLNTLLMYFRGNSHNKAPVDITHLATAEMRALEYVKSHIVITPRS